MSKYRQKDKKDHDNEWVHAQKVLCWKIVSANKGKRKSLDLN